MKERIEKITTNKTIYICEGCGKEDKNRDTIYWCEREHKQLACQHLNTRKTLYTPDEDNQYVHYDYEGRTA